MAVRPTTPPRPNPAPRITGRPSNTGNLRTAPTRNSPGPGRIGPGGVPPVRPVNYRPTPFQPGASPAPLLSPRDLGVLGIGILLKKLWDLLNSRPPGTPSEFRDLKFSTGGNRSMTASWGARRTTEPTFLCGNGAQIGAGAVAGPTPASSSFSGIGIRIERTSGTDEIVCGSGTNIAATTYAAIRQLTTSGPGPVLVSIDDGAKRFDPFLRRKLTDELLNIQIGDGVSGLSDTGQNPLIPGEFAPGTEPIAPTPTPASAPAPAPSIAPARAPAISPPAVPGSAPVPAPDAVPGGLVNNRPFVAPAPAIGPARTQILQRSTPGSQTQTVPAVGPLPQTAAPIVPVTPAEAVLIGTELIGGPGQAPAPNLQAIAQEVGRLERKGELMLSRPENGGPGEVLETGILATIRKLLEDLIRDLFNDVAGGTFTLVPPCPPPGGGDPLPPVEVPYEGGTNAAAATLAKLDGIAALIQAHKNMGQPICRTPVVGQEVTVHFEGD